MLLLKLSRDEPEAMRELYRGGIIVPILSRDRRCLGDVAESVLADTAALQWLSADDIRKHADFIDSARPRTSIDDMTDVREQQFHALHSICRDLARRTRPVELFGTSLPIGAPARRLLEWLDGQPSNSLRMSTLHRYLDTAWDPGDANLIDRVRGMALAIHADIMRRGQFAAISSFGHFTAYLALIVAGDGSPSIEDPVPNAVQRDELDLATMLSVADVVSLPLRDVVWLRCQPEFVAARRLLRSYRTGADRIDGHVLEEHLDACYGVVESFLSLTPSGRRRTRAASKSERMKTRVKVAISVGANVAVRLFSNDPVTPILSLFGSLAGHVVDRYRTSTRSAIFAAGPKRPLSPITKGYDPVAGKTTT